MNKNTPRRRAGTIVVATSATCALGILLWVGQLFLSRAWLQRHAQGPLETLWRRLAFGRATA